MLLTQKGKAGWWLVVVENIVLVSGVFGAGLAVVAVIVVAGLTVDVRTHSN